jgi:putative cell wall-binding protein
MEPIKNNNELPSYEDSQNEYLREKIKALELELKTQKEISKQLEQNQTKSTKKVHGQKLKNGKTLFKRGEWVEMDLADMQREFKRYMY